jgi:uncharacterized membrane protein YGL010W
MNAHDRTGLTDSRYASTIALFILMFIAIYNESVSLQFTLAGEALLLIAGFILRRIIDPRFTGTLRPCVRVLCLSRARATH